MNDKKGFAASPERRDAVMAFGFSMHTVTLIGSSLSLLWPGRTFLPCMNALELAGALGKTSCPVRRDKHFSLLLNLSREFHELDSALRMAADRDVPVLGAVAVDFVNQLGLRLCLDKKLPVVMGELDGREELGEARDAIRDGRRFVSRSILRDDGYRFVDFPAGFSLLSEREALCLDARLGGLNSKETSVMLDLEPSTVATYTYRAYRKLGVQSGEELAWLFAGRPMGCYHRSRAGRTGRLFPSGRLPSGDGRNAVVGAFA